MVIVIKTLETPKNIKAKGSSSDYIKSRVINGDNKKWIEALVYTPGHFADHWHDWLYSNRFYEKDAMFCPAGKGLWGSWFSVLRDMLCLSSIRCACPQCDVVVLDMPCLSAIRCAFPKYAVPVLNTLSWPFAVPVPIRNWILTLIPLYTKTWFHSHWLAKVIEWHCPGR